MVPTSDFATATDDNATWTWPCEYVEEITGRAKGAVPHHLPGENPFLKEFVAATGVPAQAARGGPETIYPEYQRQLQASVAASNVEAPRVAQAKNPDTGNIEVLQVPGNGSLLS